MTDQPMPEYGSEEAMADSLYEEFKDHKYPSSEAEEDARTAFRMSLTSEQLTVLARYYPEVAMDEIASGAFISRLSGRDPLVKYTHDQVRLVVLGAPEEAALTIPELISEELWAEVLAANPGNEKIADAGYRLVSNSDVEKFVAADESYAKAYSLRYPPEAHTLDQVASWDEIATAAVPPGGGVDFEKSETHARLMDPTPVVFLDGDAGPGRSADPRKTRIDQPKRKNDGKGTTRNGPR